MPIFTDKLPQQTQPTTDVNIFEVIALLPETIPFAVNIWVADQLARYGRTSRSIRFILEQPNETTTEQKLYFEGLMKPLEISATAANCWKDSTTAAIRLYNNGRLIIDKKTFTYTELPSPVHQCPVITAEEIISQVPETVPWKATIYLTGSVVKNGYSSNDADMIVFDKSVPNAILGEMRDFFTSCLHWKTDVGREVMLPREPVYLYKLYEDGKLCRP